MISSAKYVPDFFALVLPAIAQAQSAGIVECRAPATTFSL